MLSIVDRADYNRLKKRALVLLEQGMEFWGIITDIRDRKLYLAEFKTFREFGDHVIKLSPSHIRERCLEWEFWNSQKLLVETGQATPEAMKVVQASTPRQIRKAMEESKALPLATNSEASSKEDKKDSSPRKTLDDIGVEVPDEVKRLWNRRDEVQELVMAMQSVKRDLEKAQKEQDLLWAETELNSAICSINDGIRQIKTALPYAICPYCQGVKAKTCAFCYHRGVVSKFRFSTADQELVKMQMKKGQL